MQDSSTPKLQIPSINQGTDGTCHPPHARYLPIAFCSISVIKSTSALFYSLRESHFISFLHISNSFHPLPFVTHPLFKTSTINYIYMLYFLSLMLGSYGSITIKKAMSYLKLSISLNCRLNHRKTSSLSIAKFQDSSPGPSFQNHLPPLPHKHLSFILDKNKFSLLAPLSLSLHPNSFQNFTRIPFMSSTVSTNEGAIPSQRSSLVRYLNP